MSLKPGQHVLIREGAQQQFLREDGTFTPFDESVEGGPFAEVLESFPEQTDDLIYVRLRGPIRKEEANAFYRTEDLELI